ncbi:MAG: hypothetical protein WC676_08465 [Candidatus Omnitrophota bacterium]
MIKKMITLSLCVAVLSVSALAFAEDVYATKNGKKYHKAECVFIKNRDTQKIDQQAAVEKGLKPCGKCMSDGNQSAVEKSKQEKLASKKSSK